MHEEPDDRDLIIVDEAALPHGLARWLPTTVVLAAVAGFMALAWYAYHAGTQSVKDDDLLVVEADKTPLKEKPVDPGGMKFPDQDKTIFDTFSGKPDTPPKVERVVPAPEEPMPAQLDTSGTSTWVNQDLKKGESKTASAQPEQVIAPSPKEEKKPAPQAAKAPPPDVMAQQSPAAAASSDQTVTYHAPEASKSEAPKPVTPPVVAPKMEMAQAEPAKPAPVTAAPPKLVEPVVPAPKKAETPKAPEAAKPVAKSEAKPKSAAVQGGVMVQLGAYRSEAEAHAAWAKMVRKNADVLSGKERLIVKADLGSRGTYYRLRVPGFDNIVAAKAFCDQLAARKQACILSSGQ